MPEKKKKTTKKKESELKHLGHLTDFVIADSEIMPSTIPIPKTVSKRNKEEEELFSKIYG